MCKFMCGYVFLLVVCIRIVTYVIMKKLYYRFFYFYNKNDMYSIIL